MSHEENLDQIFQKAFKAVNTAAEEVHDIHAHSPHPSVQGFKKGNFSTTVQLGEGITYQVEGGDQVSREEFFEEVDQETAEALEACAKIWMAIGKKQMQTLSEEYLERYM